MPPHHRIPCPATSSFIRPTPLPAPCPLFLHPPLPPIPPSPPQRLAVRSWLSTRSSKVDLTSLDLGFTCYGCVAYNTIWPQHPFSPNRPADLPASVESLRFNCIGKYGLIMQRHKLEAICLRSLRDNTPRLIHLTRLELSGFPSNKDAVATVLSLLATQLRCLRLLWCRLFREKTNTHACHPSSGLGVISTLRPLDELDRSGNPMSQELASSLIADVHVYHCAGSRSSTVGSTL